MYSPEAFVSGRRNGRLVDPVAHGSEMALEASRASKRSRVLTACNVPIVAVKTCKPFHSAALRPAAPFQFQCSPACCLVSDVCGIKRDFVARLYVTKFTVNITGSCYEYYRL